MLKCFCVDLQLFEPLVHKAVVNNVAAVGFVNQCFNLLLFDKIEKPLECEVKTRYSSQTAKCTIEQIDEDTIKVTMQDKAKAVTPGQSAVFYLEDIVIGGGKIVTKM